MNKTEIIGKILYGVAVGDAVGFPYQFRPRQVRTLNKVIDMGISQDTDGTLHRVDDGNMGLWSDDTSLTLCLADSLVYGYNLQDMAMRFIKWLEQGYLSADDIAFDIGRQTMTAIFELKKILASKDYQKLSCMIEQAKDSANGNGALMRILPLITQIYHLEMAEQYKIVEEVSALTHPHVRSVVCCFLYLRIAEKIIDKYSLPEAVSQSQAELRDFLASSRFRGRLDDEDTRQLNRLLHWDLSQGTIDPDTFEEKDYVRSNGYVVSSLEAALWCLLNCQNYKETVLQAVNLGDDTDTVAAIAGGLAALHYGTEDIPQNWIEQLKKPELFQQIIQLTEAVNRVDTE